MTKLERFLKKQAEEKRIQAEELWQSVKELTQAYTRAQSIVREHSRTPNLLEVDRLVLDMAGEKPKGRVYGFVNGQIGLHWYDVHGLWSMKETSRCLTFNNVDHNRAVTALLNELLTDEPDGSDATDKE